MVPVLKKNAQDIILPALDLPDINSIKADDICRLDAEKIKGASQRYGAPVIIAGCIKQPTILGNPWTSQWWVSRDNRSDSFNFTGKTAEDVAMQAMRAFAPSATNTQKQQQTNGEIRIILRVANVNGLDQYNEIVRYLRTFAQITQVDLTKINATEVELGISVIGGQQALLTAFNAQNKLVRNTAAVLSPGIDLDYQWVTVSNEQPKAIGVKPLS